MDTTSEIGGVESLFVFEDIKGKTPWWLFSVSVDDEDTDSVGNDCFLWVWMMRILIL